MALFWRRKKEDRYITLGLNQPGAAAEVEKAEGDAPLEAPAASEATPAAPLPALEATPTGDAPTPTPVEKDQTGARVADTVIETARPSVASANEKTTQPTSAREAARPDAPGAKPSTAPRPAPARSSSFSTSVLGLDRSAEELEAEIEALEQTYAVRFSRAIAATRESLSEKIDTVFQGRKTIDAELLDELEEALIAADLGVQTTLDILDRVRRGI